MLSFWKVSSALTRISALLALSTATCFAQYTGPGALSRASLDFGAVPVNSIAAYQVMTFTFQEAETIGRVRAGASNQGGVDFQSAGGSCARGASFLLNQQCTVRVRFAPNHVGEIRGAVEIIDPNGHLIATGFVHGIGSGPRLSFSPGASTTMNGLDGASALSADSVGNVYAAKPVTQAGSFVASRVYKIRPDGSVALAYQQPVPILALTVDGAGNLYFTRGPGAGMRKVAPDGSITDFERTNSLDAIATDGEGTVYAGDRGAIDRVSATGEITLGTPEVGRGDQGEVSITGLVVPSAGQRIFDANSGVNAGGPYLRGKVFQDPQGYATVAYDGGQQALLQGLALNPDGSLVAAVTGTITPVQSSIPVLPLEGYGVAIAANGDIFIANGTVTRLSRSSAPGLSFVASNHGESVSATLSLTNTGNLPLVFDTQSAKITGPDAADFRIDSTTCNTQTGLPSGTACTVTVIFQSSYSGFQSATLTAPTNDPAYANTPVNVALAGINP